MGQTSASPNGRCTVDGKQRIRIAQWTTMHSSQRIRLTQWTTLRSAQRIRLAQWTTLHTGRKWSMESEKFFMASHSSVPRHLPLSLPPSFLLPLPFLLLLIPLFLHPSSISPILPTFSLHFKQSLAALMRGVSLLSLSAFSRKGC